jgi:hypothetical protein
MALDHGRPSQPRPVEFLIDSGVNKTLLSEADWTELKKNQGIRLKKNHTQFTICGSMEKPTILGRTKCELQAECGAMVVAYVVMGAKQSLLGLVHSEALGIVEIKPAGQIKKDVCQLSPTKIEEPHHFVSKGQTQSEIDSDMHLLVQQNPNVFQGLGKAKVDPIHIEINHDIKPVQQKAIPIALHYRDRPCRETETGWGGVRTSEE